ncbi:YbaB/EbfC family nucleoid-associated protein [Kribbella catacumbae]|uniref:YbaB/EbfC family nucleoid-associated protein n=1 Tax=Kribbella catacumbae TaxID=460086 RepID=UPI0003781781|nr:YbaB/EbfC family nucleoid-associated protein [Kribbella catacumbae]
MDLSHLKLGQELSALGLEKELERFTSASSKLDSALDAITATAVSADRLIKVTVTGRGELRGLEFDPGIYREQDVQALAASILATVSQANAAAAAKAATAYREFEEQVS